jgi:hypothetical protein
VPRRLRALIKKLTKAKLNSMTEKDQIGKGLNKLMKRKQNKKRVKFMRHMFK